MPTLAELKERYPDDFLHDGLPLDPQADRDAATIVSMLGAAKRVEVLLLRDPNEKEARWRHNHPRAAEKSRSMVSGHWVVRGRARGLNLEVARQLSDYLTTEANFSNIRYKCGFQPGIAIRVHSPEGSMTIMICFHCHEIVVVPSSSQTKSKRGEFGAGYLRLATLMKTLFPHDREIQALGTRN